jgi:hypothetical protein
VKLADIVSFLLGAYEAIYIFVFKEKFVIIMLKKMLGSCSKKFIRPCGQTYGIGSYLVSS